MWNRLDAAFAAALDLPEADRRAWLEQAFADDRDTISALSHLLQLEKHSAAYFDQLEGVRDSVLAEVTSLAAPEPDDPRIGAIYGAWRILRRIGQGGFSVVYEAERADGRYEQVCALKVIRGDRKGRAVANFLKERRILSSLDHPGIVRILDAGETATGAPWLVMDFVDGKPITDHCLDAGLTLVERLKLIVEVAEALQSAHSSLVIHRDIKPDNIIVSSQGRPRLLDFGVASLMVDEEEETRPASMTPKYASPEQSAFAKITTASDIYQLGRVLAELCEPCGPVGPQVQAVVDKATSQDAAARYETASGLAEDLRRLIRGDPPLARPETRGEAARRLVSRNKTVSVLVVMLLAGIVGWIIALNFHTRQMDDQRILALAAADRAERGRAVLLEMFRRMDPIQADGAASIPGGLKDVIEPVLANVRAQLADDAPLQAELLSWAAVLNERAGDEEKAQAYIAEAIGFLELAGMEETSIHADMIAYRGALAIASGDFESGESDIFRALAVARKAPEDDKFALSVFIRAGWSRHTQWAEQVLLFEEALPRLAAGTVNSEIEVRSGLGRAYLELGQAEDAEKQVRPALTRAERVYGPDHPRLALPLSVIAQALRWKGDVAGSIAAGRRAYEISLAAFGPEYKSTLSHQNNLALALADAGELDEATALLSSLAETYARLDGAGSVREGGTYQNLATVQMRAGQPEAALVSLEKAEAAFNASLPENTARRFFPALTRSEILLELRRFSEAQQHAEAVLKGLGDTLPSGHFAIEIARCRVGMALVGQGRRLEGEVYIQMALDKLAASDAVPERHLAACLAAGAPSRSLQTP